MVRRLKSEMKGWDGSDLFPQRQLEAIPVDYSEAERQAHTNLQRYTELRCKGVADNTEKYATEFVLKLLKKRMKYNTFLRCRVIPILHLRNFCTHWDALWAMSDNEIERLCKHRMLPVLIEQELAYSLQETIGEQVQALIGEAQLMDRKLLTYLLRQRWILVFFKHFSETRSRNFYFFL